MQFVRKHFEKVIFIVLLLLAVGLFGWQAYSVISQQDQNPEEKLKINLGRADYASIDQKSKEFSVFDGTEERFEESVREKGKLKFDLLVPPALAKCPGGAHMISRTEFPEKEGQKTKCPYCDNELKDVPLETLENDGSQEAAVDTDSDGIPDAEEIKSGLDPKSKEDALVDKDEDGFSNLEEYHAKTDISNPKSRPSYANKLFVRDIKQKKLGLRLQRIKNAKPGETEEWRLTIQSVWKNKRGIEKLKQYNVKVGDTLEEVGYSMDNYTVERIDEVAGSGKKNEENNSTVYLKRESDGMSVPLKLGEWANDPNKTITYQVNLPFETEKEITVDIGKPFSIGNEKVGVDTFTSISADSETMTAKVRTAQGNVEDVAAASDAAAGSSMQDMGMDESRSRRPQVRRTSEMPKF